MIEHVVEVSVVGVQPEQVWQWVVSMTDVKYREWHRNHRSYALLRSKDDLVGMRFHFDEVLEGKFRINLSWEIVEIEAPRRVVFRALILYPVRLELALDPTSEGTWVRHVLRIGGGSPLYRLIDPLILRLIFTAERRALLDRHAREEFKNLERLI